MLEPKERSVRVHLFTGGSVSLRLIPKQNDRSYLDLMLHLLPVRLDVVPYTVHNGAFFCKSFVKCISATNCRKISP
jgi:hypothetical protein